MQQVLGGDTLGLLATSLFLEATPVDITSYIAWLGLRGTVSASSLTP